MWDPEDGAPAPEPRRAAAVVDVFVYVVVLNLFVEYVPRVISATFTLSLLTAVLLKAVLEARAVLVGSTFLVLESVALVFGARVTLGGFVSVSLLILALLLGRTGVRLLLGYAPRGPRPALSSPVDQGSRRSRPGGGPPRGA